MAQDRRGGVGATIFLCFLGALLEGVDIQSGGLAAPKLAAEFHLHPGQVGLVLTASVIGLLCGAAIGGRLSDRIGRKAVLIGSIIALGVFSLITTVTHGYGPLVAVRFLAGLGMGGAFPNLIAIVAETASAQIRGRALSLMYCGMPLGGAAASLLTFFGGAAMDWRVIFYLGGVGPIILAPILMLGLANTAARRAASGTSAPPAVSAGQVLFGDQRAVSTMLLWVGYFFTLVVVYLLLNWLPSLMQGKGLTRPQGAMVSALMNLGAAVGSIILGAAIDRGARRGAVIATYVGMPLALAALAFLQGFTPMLAAGFSAGFFAIGGQLVLYALAPGYYPVASRGTGVGAAIAVGRLGSVLGPLTAAALLNAGYGAAAVLGAAVPGIAIAAVAVLTLLTRPGAEER